MPASIAVTTTSSGYVVAVAGGPGNADDWVGLYQANTGDYYGGYLDWKWLSDSTTPPPTGLTGATLHFGLSSQTYALEFRWYAGSTLLARGAVPLSSSVLPKFITPDGYLNVRDFGAKGNKNDDTQALRDAAAACAATKSNWGSKGLYFPPGGADTGVYVATGDVDFRGISTVKAEGAWLVAWGGDRTGPRFKFGVPYNTMNGRYVFGGLYDLTQNYKSRHPLVQFSGLHAGHVEMGACSGFAEFYAGNGDGTDTYIGMFLSRVFLGRTYRVELRSEAADSADWVGFDQTKGWLNSNNFFGGQPCHLRIGGPWRDVIGLVADGTHTIVQTASPHLFFTGNMVEMTTDNPAPGQHGLIERLDATHFRIMGSYTGTGWRAMGPGGYSHNDNHFYGSDIEDFPAMVHIEGHFNHIHGTRMEAEGELVFGPQTYCNTVEVSNNTHGRMPTIGERGDMIMRDYAAENPANDFENFYGWLHRPMPWA